MKKELEASSVIFTECILFDPKFKGDGGRLHVNIVSVYSYVLIVFFNNRRLSTFLYI